MVSTPRSEDQAIQFSAMSDDGVIYGISHTRTTGCELT